MPAVCSADRPTKYAIQDGTPRTRGCTRFQAQKSMARAKTAANPHT
jgi:hypothetical protein